MADDIVLNPGTGGDTVRAVDNAGIKTPAVAIGSGSGTGLANADATNGLDVDVTRSALPTGASTLAEQQTQTTALQLIDDAIATAGSAITAKGNAVAGTDGTNARILKTDASGELQIDVLSCATHDIGSITTAVVPGTGATNLGKAEDAQHTTGDTGVQILAVRAASPTDRSAGPTDGDYEPIAVNDVGAVWVSMTPSANGGASTMNATSGDGSTALTNTAQAIKASAGVLTGYYIYNPNAAAVWVQFYNTASGSVTVGTTNPLFPLCIPAASAANLAFANPVGFSTAMSWAATSTAGGNGAPTTALEAVCWYK